MGTRYQGTETEVTTLNAYIALERASERLSARMAAQLAPHAITLSQFGVLDALYHIGRLASGELAAKLLKSNGNLTLVITNLEKHGLVKRTRDRADRRCIRISLTEAGRTLYASVMPEHVETLVDQFSRLTLEEQRQLKYLCRKLGGAVPQKDP